MNETRIVLLTLIAMVACSNPSTGILSRPPTTKRELAQARPGTSITGLAPVTTSVANVAVTYVASCPGAAKFVDVGGTAFNVSYEGIWMTAEHVVSPAKVVACGGGTSVTARVAKIRLLLEPSGAVCDVEVFAREHAIDAALLAAVPPVPDRCRGVFDPFKLETRTALSVNETLSVIGYPSESSEYLNADVADAQSDIVRVRAHSSVFEETQWRNSFPQAVFREYFARRANLRVSQTSNKEAIMSTPQAIPGQSGGPLLRESTMSVIGMVVQRAPGKTYSIPARPLYELLLKNTGRIVFGEAIDKKMCMFVKPAWEPAGYFHNIPLSDDTRLRPGLYEVGIGYCDRDASWLEAQFGTPRVEVIPGVTIKVSIVDGRLYTSLH